MTTPSVASHCFFLVHRPPCVIARIINAIHNAIIAIMAGVTQHWGKNGNGILNITKKAAVYKALDTNLRKRFRSYFSFSWAGAVLYPAMRLSPFPNETVRPSKKSTPTHTRMHAIYIETNRTFTITSKYYSPRAMRLRMRLSVSCEILRY